MSLRWRLAIVSSLVTVAALAVLGLASGLALRAALERDLDDELRVQARVTLDDAVQDQELDKETEDALSTSTGSSTAWVYLDGQLVRGAGTPDAPEPLDAIFLNDASAAAAIRSVAGWRVASLRDGPVAVQVGRSLGGIGRTLASYAGNAALLGAGAALLAGLATTFAVGRVTKPLAQLVARVERLESDAPVPALSRGDEVGSLARALDASLHGLRSTREREARFLADAAHELRTPVAAMLAELEHHRARPRGETSDRDLLGRAERHARHLRDLSNNLLALTQAERGFDRVRTDLLELASDVADRLAPLAAAKNLGIAVDGEAGIVMGDPLLLTRAIENLVANAIKFSDAGEVRLTARAGDDTVTLEVGDTGPGIAADALERVLEPFHREPRSRVEGSGLGLAVVRAVTEAHGGRLTLQSTPGQGTTASIALPRAAAKPVRSA